MGVTEVTPQVSAPHLIVKPENGASVNAAYATFEWKQLKGADGYRFELAEDATFSNITVDASVGETTSLTLFESIPADGRLRYARVKALENGQTIAISATTTFRPVSGAAVEEVNRPTSLDSQWGSTPFKSEPALPDVETAPWKSSMTSVTEVSIIMGVMILTLAAFGWMMIL